MQAALRMLVSLPFFVPSQPSCSTRRDCRIMAASCENASGGSSSGKGIFAYLPWITSRKHAYRRRGRGYPGLTSQHPHCCCVYNFAFVIVGLGSRAAKFISVVADAGDNNVCILSSIYNFIL
jgi:hypothetical protein